MLLATELETMPIKAKRFPPAPAFNAFLLTAAALRDTQASLSVIN
jgi:hypothetical protein